MERYYTKIISFDAAKVIRVFIDGWLNKKMFDYRGLIPMGLALEAKEGMYDWVDFKDAGWKYYPKDRFSSYEEYAQYLKREGLAVDAPKGKYNN